MLRAITDDDPPPPTPYRVPWRVDRARAAHPVVINDGGAPVEFVRVFVVSPDDLTPARSIETLYWGRMLPGESGDVCLCSGAADATVATIAWFRPDDGVEYLWAFAP